MAAGDTDGQEKKKEISGGPGQEFAKKYVHIQLRRCDSGVLFCVDASIHPVIIHYRLLVWIDRYLEYSYLSHRYDIATTFYFAIAALAGFASMRHSIARRDAQDRAPQSCHHRQRL